MKLEEAIENLKYLISEDCCDTQMDYVDEIEIAIQALEKQVPKKPEMYIGDYEFERWPICPKCKGELHPNGEKFCSDCGQAIDWSEIDE